jgi:MoaA/NifB/PqqE/SkfB family radical SAM enzyme
MRFWLFLLRLLFHKKTRYAHLMAFIRYNSPVRLSNFIYNEFERRIKRVKLFSKPYLINSEPTGFCNLRCLFCPTGKRSDRAGGFTDPAIYERLFKEIGKFTYLMTMHGWGEPTLHKELPRIISMAHRHRIFTVVTTNGSLLTREMSRKIILSGLDYLILSCDGISEETYGSYHIGGSFETVMNNLRELVSAKRELRSRTPFIEWQFIVFRHNEHEMADAEVFAKEAGVDNLVFMPAYTEDESYDATDEKYHLPKVSPLSKRSDCKHLWSTLTFHWNGCVVPCCYDYNGKISYGDLREQGFGQIWNNRNFQESRKIIKFGLRGSPEDLYCATCVGSIGQSCKELS